PVSEDALALLAQRVEDELRATGCSEVTSQEVGLAVLGPLRELDDVAYLRFASVYRGFESLEDFEAEIALQRAERALERSETVERGRPVPSRGVDDR
ncbi:MAG: transcriptional regulator NrdR, partial [Acidothermus cellulolyticus]|nr:transcriptional regulator NrdR [Acidothermus cellulolyticus]